MVNSGQIKGVVSYISKLTHPVDEFNITFSNIELDETIKNLEDYLDKWNKFDGVKPVNENKFMLNFFNFINPLSQ